MKCDSFYVKDREDDEAPYEYIYPVESVLFRFQSQAEEALRGFMLENPDWLDEADWTNPFSAYKFSLGMNRARIEWKKFLNEERAKMKRRS